MGTAEHIAAQGRLRCDEERRLLSQLSLLEDLRAAWLLLSFCAGPRFNHWVRVVPPSLREDYAREHDLAMWDLLWALLTVPPMGGQRTRTARALASLPGGREGSACAVRFILARLPSGRAGLMLCLSFGCARPALLDAFLSAWSKGARLWARV